MIRRMAILLLEGILGGFLWRVVHWARAVRKRRTRLLEMELRLEAGSNALHEEVFRLKHYLVLRPHASRQNAGFIPSTKVSSLRYIKGRQK